MITKRHIGNIVGVKGINIYSSSDTPPDIKYGKMIFLLMDVRIIKGKKYALLKTGSSEDIWMIPANEILL